MPQLTQLWLNVLPFYLPRDFPPSTSLSTDRDIDFRYLPLTLWDGKPFPRHSLVGSSRRILAHATRLKSLQLRDPQAEASWLAPLSQLQVLQVYISPWGPQPLDLEALKTRELLPQLAKLSVRLNDCKNIDARFALSEEIRLASAFPFEIEFMDEGSRGQVLLCEADDSWQESLDSPEEFAIIWDV